MDFKKATDELFDGVAHQELAKALGVSVATIRQARLSTDAKAHRSPPEGWQRAIGILATRRIRELSYLVKYMERHHDS